jgi:hypothetical protein
MSTLHKWQEFIESLLNEKGVAGLGQVVAGHGHIVAGWEEHFGI